MKSQFMVSTGVGAVLQMIAYYSIPFLIVDGAAESIAKLRPFLLLGSLALILLGFFQLRRVENSTSPPSRLSIAVFLSLSILVLGMVLFPEAIASFLANSFAS